MSPGSESQPRYQVFLYNANLNLFTLEIIQFEFMESGLMLPRQWLPKMLSVHEGIEGLHAWNRGTEVVLETKATQEA